MPRTYPPKFAIRVTKYYSRFCSRRVAFPESVDSQLGVLSAKDIFSQVPWEEEDPWSDAQLGSVVFYLRGAKGLNLGDWRPLFPESIPI